MKNKKQKIKAGRKVVSLILTVAMLLTAQGIPVLAETAGEAADAVKAGSSPANPVHNCTKKDDGTDTTAWSYVYFGSYPQTEVTGSALTAAITGAAYDASGDAWVNGTKYRRMKKSDANHSNTSSGYFPWNGENDYHYFKWERIKWRVLKVDESTMFVAADKGLDCKNYGRENASITWEKSTLRSWLNNVFYGRAFSGGEQGAIVAQTVVNKDNPYYDTEGGNDTYDKVYLLSIGEVTNPNYGFCENYSTYSASRRVKASDYAHARGAWVNNSSNDFAGNCYWWLRSPGTSTFCAACVNSDGDVRMGGGGPYVYYDNQVCVPALHINLSSDLWSMVDDGSSGEGGGGTDNSDIIARVSEYTSDQMYAQFDEIMSSNYSSETKFKLLQSLFQSYGITDVKEGTKYLSNTTDKRYAYLNLMTDERYCAYNFRYWLKNTPKGAAAQAVLFADGLIFNGEVNDWLDFTTYAESDYPGVSKYKTMLYDFMDATSDKIEIMSQIKLVSDMASKVTGAAKLKANSLIAQLNRCSGAAEASRILNSSEAMEVWVSLAEAKDSSGNFVRDENGSIKLTYQLDSSSGFGQFAKAMGYAAKTVSIANMALTDVLDLLTLDSKLAIYAQYKRFLQDVVSNTEGIPFQLRWAAASILTELDQGYIGKIGSIAMDIVEQTFVNSEVLKGIIGETAAGSLGSWLSVIGIESFFINKISDIGNMVRNEACVEGYAALSIAFAKNLERAKQAFLAAKTEENAWDFYYNYNILYKLRYKGEQAYLAMTKVKGFASCFSDFGYAQKEAVVNDTLSMLESKCQFTMEEAAALPESCQFAAKSVIHCPVNVSVYAADGSCIAELLDGTESDVTNAYGRFAVVHDSYSGDYVKVICLNQEENVSIQMTGTDDGLVSMELARAEEEESGVYVFDNIPVGRETVITASIDQIVQENTYDMDTDGDGLTDETGTITVKQETYIPVESAVCSEDKVSLKEGESTMLGVSILPSNATRQDIAWMSADTSVASVAGGKVTAAACGTTVIYGMILDNMEKTVVCEVEVTKDSVTTDPGGDSENPDKETALAKAKERSKGELESYRNASDYREAQQKELSDAVVVGKTAIDAAEDEEGVSRALSDAKAEIDKIKTDAQLTEAENKAAETVLAKAKERSKGELDSYRNASDYREAQQKELANAIAAGKTAIDAAEDEAGVNRAFSDAKAAIDQIKTNEQLTLEEQKKSGGGTETDLNSGKINAPKATSIKGRIKAKSRGFLVKWKKRSDVDGYQIQYSANKKFKKKSTKIRTVKKPSLTKLNVKKLKSGKKYYVRVRTYKTMNGTALYSGWSKAKTVKVK